MVGKDLLKILKESKYTTVLSGFEMLQENGYPAIRDGEESYDIEQKYGYSVDEMFTSAFYSTRKPQFFEFYRNELLSALDIPPGKGYLEMAELEEKGLFQTIITRRVFGLPERAGCKNVINLMRITVRTVEKNIRWNISGRQREFLFVRNVMHQFVQVCV